MPCRDYGAEEESRRNTVERLNKFARMMCALCHEIEHYHGGQQLLESLPEVNDWWIQHQKDDAKAAQDEIDQRARDVERARKDLEKATQTLQNLMNETKDI